MKWIVDVRAPRGSLAGCGVFARKLEQACRPDHHIGEPILQSGGNVAGPGIRGDALFIAIAGNTRVVNRVVAPGDQDVEPALIGVNRDDCAPVFVV